MHCNTPTPPTRGAALRNLAWMAVRLLEADKRKYITMLLSVALSSHLMAQQMAIFCGLMMRTIGQIRDVRGVDIWVMDPNVQFVEDIRQMPESSVDRVRGVPGVRWATPMHRNLTRLRLRDGNYQMAVILGVDDGSLVGAPDVMLAGRRENLLLPERVLMDDAGYSQLWPGSDFQLGRELEINEHRAVIAGVCSASRTFNTFPVIYARFRNALNYAPPERHAVSFVLARVDQGEDPEVVCGRIQKQTGLLALTVEGFSHQTMRYFLERTGIAINFAVTVTLGLVVGAVVTGQTFRIFTCDHLPQYATLKALGMRSSRLAWIVAQQAFVIGFAGLGLGLGGAAICGEFMQGATKLAFYMPWQVAAITVLAVAIMLVLASAGSIRSVIRLDPKTALSR